MRHFASLGLSPGSHTGAAAGYRSIRALTMMNIYIFAVASLAFALAVTAAILCLVWRTRRKQETIRQLTGFAETLPQDERALFWRLYQNRELWNGSRYPKAFHKWKKRHLRAGLVAPTEAKA